MTDKFKQFLTSLEDYDKPLIESIRNGFSVIYEASNKTPYTDTYNHDNNIYELISESPEYIFGLIKQSPTLINAIQQNNIQPESINKIDISVYVEAEGNGYYGGSKGSWDDPGEESSFEDGIEATLSNMLVNIYTTTENVIEEIEIDDNTDPAIYKTIQELVEQNDSLYENVLNDYENDASSNRAYSRAEYQVENREAKWQRNLDKY
jgi:hypothetical protein